MVLDVGYNGVVGSHLQAGLLNYNQVPFSALEQYGAHAAEQRRRFARRHRRRHQAALARSSPTSGAARR